MEKNTEMNKFTRYTYTCTVITDRDMGDEFIQREIDKAIKKIMDKANYMNIGFNSLEKSKAEKVETINL